MPRVGFEPTIPAFKRTKTVHALDRAANAIGGQWSQLSKNYIPRLSNVMFSPQAVDRQCPPSRSTDRLITSGVNKLCCCELGVCITSPSVQNRSAFRVMFSVVSLAAV
jgi:hypothetical protein